MSERKLWSIATVITVIFLVAAFSYLWLKQKSNNLPEVIVKTETPITIEKKTVTEILPENTADIPAEIIAQNKNLTSENFTIKQVRFGGDTLVAGDDQESLPIEIYDIKSEVFADKKGEESRAVITWKSNKLTNSEISYAKNNGQGSKTAKENGFGFSHSLVLPNLAQGTGYLYQIKSKDRWNNSLTSGFYGIYSGSRAVSVFELVGKAFDDIFGWAINEK
ncbi:MAG: fibronectin type III domain-containing protein [Candidatus Moranbacteria bacterium]|nr:fibronectin type III domain-containing protein [Candidatus Moranbacteria bacterium]